MPPYKITMLGGAGVGKTALTLQLMCNYFIQTYDPTVEDFYRKRMPIDNEHCTLEILDTAGVEFEHYQDAQESWINNGEGFVLVYSISSRSSFLRVSSLYQQIQRLKKPLGLASCTTTSTTVPESAIHASVLLVGNKCDKNTEREVSVQEGFTLARALGCQFIESSAQSSLSVQKTFYDVVRLLRSQHTTLSQIQQAPYLTRSPRLRSRRVQNFKKQQWATLMGWARSCSSKGRVWKEKRYGTRGTIWSGAFH